MNLARKVQDFIPPAKSFSQRHSQFGGPKSASYGVSTICRPSKCLSRMRPTKVRLFTQLNSHSLFLRADIHEPLKRCAVAEVMRRRGPASGSRILSRGELSGRARVFLYMLYAKHILFHAGSVSLLFLLTFTSLFELTGRSGRFVHHIYKDPSH